MVKDRNKGIKTITYNHLNLPLRISMTNFQFIDYQYNALGQKVSKTVTDNEVIKVVDYLDASTQFSTGSFQYAGEVLQFFPHAEGYVKATAMNINPNNPEYSFNYVFNYTDHLGNVRVSYTKDPQTRNLKILDESHYYPFGLKHQEYSTFGFVSNPIQGVIIAPLTNNPYKYKFGQKEYQDELNLNVYDFHARIYDPAAPRFWQIDPLADQRASMTPYNYVSNNPIVRIDPTGMLDDWYQSEAGDYVYDADLTADNASERLSGNETYLGESYSIKVTQNGEQIGNVNLNANGSADFTTTDGQITEFNDMTVDMGFSSGHKIMAGNYQNGDMFSKGNFIAGAVATGLENTRGSFRFGTTKQGLSPKYYGNSWGGNQYAKTFNIGKIGTGLGYLGFGAGLIKDGYGVFQYYNDPGSQNAVHPGKAGLNTTMGSIGLYGGPIGAAVSGFYFGVDAFYPGGWTGALNYSGSLLEQNQAIHGSGFNLYKDW